jgi:hypothetical protein
MHQPVVTIVSVALALAFAATGLAAPPPERTTVVVEVEDGFHWLDAGVGAAAVLALVALGHGVVLLRRTATPPKSEGRPHG